MTIDRLRREASKATNFDLRRFHKRLLSHGGLPLDAIEVALSGASDDLSNEER